jgi:hypothetical protein
MWHFVLSQEFNLIHDRDSFLAFEFAHLLIFGVSMFYTMTAVVTANRLAYTETQWQRIANLDTNTLVDRLVGGPLSRPSLPVRSIEFCIVCLVCRPLPLLLLLLLPPPPPLLPPLLLPLLLLLLPPPLPLLPPPLLLLLLLLLLPQEEALKKRSDQGKQWKGFGPLWHSLLLDIVKVVDRWEDGEWKMCRLIFLREFGLGNDFDFSKCESNQPTCSHALS